MNVSTGKIPNDAALFQQKEDMEEVKDSIREKAIKPAPYMNSYKLTQHVRLRIPKSKLDKFDRNNWSNQKFKITRVYFRLERKWKMKPQSQ